MNSPLRVCFVGPMLGSNPGLTPNPMEQLAPHLEAQGIRYLLTSSQPNRYVRPIDILRTIIRNARRIDVLCIQVYGGRTSMIEDLASVLGRFFRHSVVMVLHGGALPAFMDRHPRWARRVLARAHCLVAPSEYLAGTLQRMGFHPEIIPNSIDPLAYRYRHRTQLEPRILWMRAFHPIYRPELAIRSLKVVLDHYPSALLTLAGQDKGMLQDLDRLANQLEVNDHIRFIGFLDAQAKRREFDRHDIFLNTSSIDNMPLTLLEAAASGLPIVTTRVGGIEATFHDRKDCLFVDCPAPDEIATHILSLLSSPEISRHLSSQGRALAERFFVPRIAPLWMATFREVLDRKVI